MTRPQVPTFLETYELPSSREAMLALDGQWHFMGYPATEGDCHDVTHTESCPGAGGD